MTGREVMDLLESRVMKGRSVSIGVKKGISKTNILLALSYAADIGVECSTTIMNAMEKSYVRGTF